ncbi:MAG: type II toxin-antitoxin system RelE/ParE family toxin [Nostoc sp.]|uniref:type II toxin-antitoxin system RelE/ParE family toxin n=1 Tax=Nostoc sp. TaxID=1180 RepID=UPI002FF289FC
MTLKPDGTDIFSEWLESLRDRKAKAKIRARLDRVEDGNLGDSKSVGDGVFELRIDYSSGYRIYFGQEGSTIIIVLCGGDKSTQDKDIVKAKEYWKDYRSRDDA